jgi:hypothetical protein
MRRLLPFLAAAAALTAAAPASAAIYPACAAQLTNAAYGASTTCYAGNSPQAVSGAVTRRVFTVEVTQGAVVASISCGYGVYERSTSKFMYAVPGPQTIRVLENPDTTCRNTLTSQVTGTVAHGVSTFDYYFIGPVA